MPIPVSATAEASSTDAAAWKKLFASAETNARTGVAIRNHSTTEAIRVHVLTKGASAPAASDADDDTMYVVDPGSTYPLDDYTDYRTDVYVRGADDGAVDYRAWELLK